MYHSWCGDRMFKSSDMKMIFYDEVDSTMEVAIRKIQEGFESPFMIVAKQQTEGRGRGVNIWFSSHGGIYLTMVIPLEDEITNEIIAMIHYSSALAVASSLNDLFSIDVRIKWPNDIVKSKKKIGGVLIEYITGAKNFLLIGIGINANIIVNDLPIELQKNTISLLSILGFEIELNKLIDKLKLELIEFSILTLNKKFDFIIEKFNKKCIYTQKEIIMKDSQQFTCMGINKYGQLSLENKNEERYLKIEESNLIKAVKN